jgi:hypothetical protein
MIGIAVAHIIVHWKWFLRMGRRMWQQLLGRTGRLNARGRINLWANLSLALSFILCSLSGVYFLFVSGGRSAFDPMFLFSRTVWDMIHTWSGIGMIVAVLVHFAIHWNWVINNAGRLLRSALGIFRRPSPLTGESVPQA